MKPNENAATCRTCKHWCAGSWATIDPRREFISSSRACGKLRDVLDIELDQGSGYDAGGASIEDIDTPADFGCNKHEPWSAPTPEIQP